jgi:hypothetical protein
MLVRRSSELSRAPRPPFGSLDLIQARSDTLPRIVLALCRPDDRPSKLLTDDVFEPEPPSGASIQEDLRERRPRGSERDRGYRADDQRLRQIPDVLAVERKRGRTRRA